MKALRLGIFLGLAATIAVACSGGDNGTPSIDGEDAGRNATKDAGKKDGTAGDGAAIDTDADTTVVDAGKKDTGVKDVTTIPDVGSDVVTTVDAGTDTGASDANVADAFVDAGPPSTTLVINEIDYDQPGTDGPEFVEILNKSGVDTVDLTNLQIVFFNGGTAGAASNEYLRIDLGPGSLAPGQYLLVNAASVADAGAAALTRDLGVGKSIQNGPRDSIIIADKNTNAVIDAVTYQALVGNNAPPTNATYNLVEGNMTTAFDSNTVAGSLVRDPNGSDTNDNSVDFKFTTTITPGAENVVTN
ncbi:MAG: lamin tail domain-containing protein [Polyangiaceae bacterium]